MSAAVLYMSVSLDGNIAGPNDNPSNPGGDGFGRLHDWFDIADTKHAQPSHEVWRVGRRIQGDASGADGEIYEALRHWGSEEQMKRDLLRIVQEHQAMEGIANEIAHHHPGCRLV